MENSNFKIQNKFLRFVSFRDKNPMQILIHYHSAVILEFNFNSLEAARTKMIYFSFSNWLTFMVFLSFIPLRLNLILFQLKHFIKI